MVLLPLGERHYWYNSTLHYLLNLRAYWLRKTVRQLSCLSSVMEPCITFYLCVFTYVVVDHCSLA